MRVSNSLTSYVLGACLALAVAAPALAGPPGSGGTFVADLNGDGISDIVLEQDGTNVLVGYILDDTASIVDQGAMIQLPQNYTIWGFADTDGDSKTDLIYYDIAGNFFVTRVDGLTVSTTNAITTLNPATWTIIGIANIDAANGADIVAYRVKGVAPFDLVIYGVLLGADGFSIVSQGDIINPLSAAFDPLGLADVDANDTADLILKGDVTTGHLYFGFALNGLVADPGHAIVAVGPPWAPSTLGDINGDGVNDLVIYNTTTRLVYGFGLGNDQCSGCDGWQPLDNPESNAIVALPPGMVVAGSGNYNGVQNAKSTSDILLTSDIVFTFLLETTIADSNAIMAMPSGYTNLDDQGVVGPVL